MLAILGSITEQGWGVGGFRIPFASVGQLARRSRSPSAYLTLMAATPWKTQMHQKKKKKENTDYLTGAKSSKRNILSISPSARELTPGKVRWLFKALIALSASSMVAYFTKQHSAEVNILI